MYLSMSDYVKFLKIDFLEVTISLAPVKIDPSYDCIKAATT